MTWLLDILAVIGFGFVAWWIFLFARWRFREWREDRKFEKMRREALRKWRGE